MTEIEQHARIHVFSGVDGKGSHYPVALDGLGKRLLDRVLPNNVIKLTALIDGRKGHGAILLAVDQPAATGALPWERFAAPRRQKPP